MTKPPKKKFLITHQIVKSQVSLNVFLTRNLKLPSSTAEFLLIVGAIYVNDVRATSEQELKPNDYIRVHHEPKRFQVEGINWRDTIVHENKDMIVINKPYGIPVHATLDNRQENVICQLSKTLHSPVLVTHRLDIGTSGLLILAKSLPAQKNINEQFAFKKVRKFYTAVVAKELATGIYTHYMKRDLRAPKVLSKESQPNYKKCDLEVLSCKPLNDGYFEIEIELFTGRSHQIRAQFALLEAPILGDEMYGGLAHPAPKYFGEFYFLASTQIKIFDFDFKIPFSLKPYVLKTAVKSLPKTLF